MDFYTTASSVTVATGAEQRKSPRKPLKRSVSVGTHAQGIVRGHTCDISMGGLSVMIPVALAVDTLCAIRFDLFIDGNLVRISGAGKVAYCSCSGLDGFRIGLRFMPQDAKSQTQLNTFLEK
jgi:hypothetical protein